MKMAGTLKGVAVMAAAAFPIEVAMAGFPGNVIDAGKRTIEKVHDTVTNATGTTDIISSPGKVESEIKEGSKVVGKLGGDVVREFGIGARNIERETRKAGNDVGTSLKKAAADTERTARQFGGDVGRELKNSQGEIGSAATAVYRFAVREAEGSVNTVRGAEKRFREGKVIDAVWSLGVTPLQNTSGNASQLATENAIVGMVMQGAASIYGGPAGAAAYAAWLTYNQTGGDVNAALRVALVSAIKSAAPQFGSNPATATVPQAFKQAAVAGTMNGLAVAAAGGSPGDMQKALIATAGSMLVQDGYQALAKAPGVAQFAKSVKQVYCVKGIAERKEDKSCPTLKDYVKDAQGRYAMLTPKGLVQYVNKAKSIPGADWVFLTKEQAMKRAADEAGLKIDLSKLPIKDIKTAQRAIAGVTKLKTEVNKVKNANIVSLLDDRWAISYTPAREVAKLKASVAPAVVLTYTGISKAVQAQARNAINAAPNRPQEIVSCLRGAQNFRTGVAASERPNDLKCAVIEQMGDAKPTWQWYGKRDATFCRVKMLETANRKLTAGFTCAGR